jgi:hypothetical protein
MNDVLDDAPVGTLLTIAVAVVIVIAYISNDLSVFEALLALGAGTTGAGVIGKARADSGKGHRKRP